MSKCPIVEFKMSDHETSDRVLKSPIKKTSDHKCVRSKKCPTTNVSDPKNVRSKKCPIQKISDQKTKISDRKKSAARFLAKSVRETQDSIQKDYASNLHVDLNCTPRCKKFVFSLFLY